MLEPRWRYLHAGLMRYLLGGLALLNALVVRQALFIPGRVRLGRLLSDRCLERLCEIAWVWVAITSEEE